MPRLELSAEGITEFDILNRERLTIPWNRVVSIERAGTRRIDVDDQGFWSIEIPRYVVAGPHERILFDASVQRFQKFVRVVQRQAAPSIAAEFEKLLQEDMSAKWHDQTRRRTTT